MKYIFVISFVMVLCGCQSRKKLEKTFVTTFSSGPWRVTQVIDNFYGSTDIYGLGHIPKDGLLNPESRDLGQFKVAVKFDSRDSTLNELDYWYPPTDSSFKNSPDKYKRKWYVANKGLIIKIDTKKVENGDNKPVLYGSFQVLSCTDSLVVLKRNLDKTKWTRTFILEK